MGTKTSRSDSKFSIRKLLKWFIARAHKSDRIWVKTKNPRIAPKKKCLKKKNSVRCFQCFYEQQKKIAMGSSPKNRVCCGRMWEQTHTFAVWVEKKEVETRRTNTENIFYSVISKIAFQFFFPSRSRSPAVCRKEPEKEECSRIFQDINCVCSSRIESVEENSFQVFNLKSDLGILWCVRCECVFRARARVIKLKSFLFSFSQLHNHIRSVEKKLCSSNQFTLMVEC